MKKKIFSLFIGVLGFFFFSCYKVNASTVDHTLNFDDDFAFNFYYEFINNTPFYRFISGMGNGFSNYLKSFSPDGSDVFFAYSSFLDSTIQSHIPEDSKYVILITGKYNRCYLYYLNGAYGYYCPAQANATGVTYLFYDEDANYLGTYGVSGSDLHLNLVSNNITVLSGSYFGNLYNLNSSGISWCNVYNSPYYTNGFDVRVTGMYYNNTFYRLTGLGTTSFLEDLSDVALGIHDWFSRIITGSTYYEKANLGDYGLAYFNKNFMISSTGTLTSIYQAFSYSDTFKYSVSVPSGYRNQSFNYNNRYFLIPNSNSCSNSELLLYFNTSDTSTINFISYDMLSDELSVDNMKTYSFQLKHANSIEVLSLHSVVGSYENIIKNFYLISSSDNFGTNTFYYNPVCYSSYSAIDSNDLTFTNVNTGNQVTVTPAEKQLIIYNSNETIDNIIAETDLNLTDIISGAWNGSKTFISASYYILSMSTTLFTSLPNEVKGVLLCVFTVGMIVILWKVFRS